MRGLLHVAGDLLRRAPCSSTAAAIAAAISAMWPIVPADLLDRLDRVVVAACMRGDLRADLVGRLRGLRRRAP